MKMKKAILFVFIAMMGLILAGCFTMRTTRTTSLSSALSTVERNQQHRRQGNNANDLYELVVLLDTDYREDRDFFNQVKLGESYVILVDSNDDTIYIRLENPLDSQEPMTKKQIAETSAGLLFFKIDLTLKHPDSGDIPRIVGFVDFDVTFETLRGQYEALDAPIIFLERLNTSNFGFSGFLFLGEFEVQETLKARFRKIYNNLEVLR
jgi:hypothetical protein